MQKEITALDFAYPVLFCIPYNIIFLMSAQLDIALMSYFCRFEAFFVFKYPFGRKLLERLTSDFRYEKRGAKECS